MPMKRLKTETESELRVERIHHVKRYSLTLDKGSCKGCGVCETVCPKKAIKIIKTAKSYYGERAKNPTIDVSEEKCIYCGMCEAICPFGALRTRIDGEHVIPVVRTESFPKIIREIQIDTKKCEVGCSDCEKACPLKIIKPRKISPVERAREILKSTKDKNVKLRPIIELKEDACAGCRICEEKCPQKAIRIRKIFHGTIKINREKCPKNCQDCLDVCPFQGALYLSNEGKVHANQSHCTYCGICKIVCPEEGALDFKRTYINHTQVHSAAWNRALENLTSTKELSKELEATSMVKVRESVKKRFQLNKTEQ